ncbi:MAG: NAD(P)-dependent oxidoreductase [Anaerolineae bacterium]|nr:NAD(P)-dependent oxidoreductase [Anaerolineae bacterium]
MEKPNQLSANCHPPQLLITGGCGKIGATFARFAAPRYAIRIVDRVPWDTVRLGSPPGESLVLDLQDPEACRQACAGMDFVLHLAADASPEADFTTSLLPNNIIATANLFRAARDAGCRRLIFASSAHVVSAYPPDVQIHAAMPVRPGNLYGVSKAFGEALAAHFAFNEGLPTIVLRIGAYVLPEELATWNALDELNAFLSAADLNTLLLKCLETPNITFAIAHAISNNRFKRLDLTETRALLGYEPQADAFDIFPIPPISGNGLT